MVELLSKRRYLVLWQILLLILGTTWLWAPQLNHLLSYRVSLISQYETPSQAFSWLFRTGDLLSGLLVLLMAYILLQKPEQKVRGYLLAIIGMGMVADPLLSTTCRQVGSMCQEYFSFSFLLHAIETVITSAAFFIAVCYDAWLRKKVVSISLAIFMICYGALFVSQLVGQEHFNTPTQYVYQISLIVWLAWFCRDINAEDRFTLRRIEPALVKKISSIWAFINGIAAILVSLAHINLLGEIKGLYFAGDNAWLAQHGVIIGVAMLYLSRHLARGEMRARQIFLAITAVETLKYSIISPNAVLMASYFLTFVFLFVLRDDFDRGTVPLTWRLRLKDAYYMVVGLLLAAGISLLALDRDGKVSRITSTAFDHFFDYVNGHAFATHQQLRSVLLAHTASVFLASGFVSIIWILFRPYKGSDLQLADQSQIKNALSDYSNSTEDFFKLWPQDKHYYWSPDGKGFVAYKLAGPVAFVLADPISRQRSPLFRSFLTWAKARRLKVCVLPIYNRSLDLYKKLDMEIVQIGSSATINIEHYTAQTSNEKWWRWKRNRGEKAGYLFNYSEAPHSQEMLAQLEVVSDGWLGVGNHIEHGFAMGYFDRDYLNQCRIFYLEDNSGKIIAFANQIPQFKSSRVATIDLLRYSPEHQDAMPYLLYKIIQQLHTEDKKFFDLGFVPFARAKGPIPTIAQALSEGRFSAKGLEQFKNKFDPEWHPNYLAYDGDLADLATIAINIERVMAAK